MILWHKYGPIKELVSWGQSQYFSRNFAKREDAEPVGTTCSSHGIDQPGKLIMTSFPVSVKHHLTLLQYSFPHSHSNQSDFVVIVIAAKTYGYCQENYLSSRNDIMWK